MRVTLFLHRINPEYPSQFGLEKPQNVFVFSVNLRLGVALRCVNITVHAYTLFYFLSKSLLYLMHLQSRTRMIIPLSCEYAYACIVQYCFNNETIEKKRNSVLIRLESYLAELFKS